MEFRCCIRKIRRQYYAKQHLKQGNTEEYLERYKEIGIAELDLTPTQRWVLEKNNIFSIADLLKFYFVNGEIKMSCFLGDSGSKTIISKLKNLSGFNIMKEKYLQQVKEKAENKDFASIQLGGLGLSVRTTNALRRFDCNTIQDLVDLYQTEGTDGILRIRNLGKGGLDEILDLLEKYTNLNQLNDDFGLNQ